MTQTDELGKKAALLSVVEVGLGSLLHAYHIPFAGHLLSLNQGLILSWATRQIPKRATPGLVSTCAALLKSLSPAGKKLTPMLAIALQGQLFSLGLLIFGCNLLGHIFGMILLCLWGFLQPLLMFYLLYGSRLLDVGGFYLAQLNQFMSVTPQTLVMVLVTVVGLKIVLGLSCVGLAHRLTERDFERYQQWVAQWAKSRRPAHSQSAWRGALQDMLSPLFIISWSLTLIFVVYAQSEAAPMIWLLLRPLALGFLLFLILRLIPLERLAQLTERRSPRLAQILLHALKLLRRDG